MPRRPAAATFPIQGWRFATERPPNGWSHDEDAEVYTNGALAISPKGFRQSEPARLAERGVGDPGAWFGTAAGRSGYTSERWTTAPKARVCAREPWSPESPVLYDLDLALREPDGAPVDEVRTYVGFRTIEARNGKLLLNGRPFFWISALDQGYWPDGLYTPKTDDLQREDVAWARRYGLNGIRKHLIVAEPRFYYWCDRLGLTVWEEMPDWGADLREADRFLKERLAWPDRPASAKGFRHEGQPVVISETGNWWIAEFPPEGPWAPYGAGPAPTAEAFLALYRDFFLALMAEPECAGFSYVQLYDVEGEVNGYPTYDRRPKLSPEAISAIHAEGLRQRAASPEASDRRHYIPDVPFWLETPDQRAEFDLHIRSLCRQPLPRKPRRIQVPRRQVQPKPAANLISPSQLEEQSASSTTVVHHG